MKKIYLYAFLGLMTWTESSFAFNYGEFVSCNDLSPKPAVTFKSSYGKLYHILSTTTEQINQIAEMSPEDKEKGMFAEGLAIAPIAYVIRLKNGDIQRLDDKYSCLIAREIEVFVGYQQPVIYVTNTYDYNSCRFSVIIRHEQTHQRINKLTLEYYLPLLDKAIREAIYDVRAVKVLTDNEADYMEGWRQLDKYYSARLKPIMEEFVNARQREQNKLDNLGNYQMEWELCAKYDKEHAAEKDAE